jgi:aminoglycoside phosphotransferase (APT) family kinase protein
VLGAPFYVMERVPGTPYRRAAQLEPLGSDRTTELGYQLVDILARLHAVDPDQVGLADFGRPHGFLERQVRRWGQQLEGSKTQDRPEADRLHRLLTERVPAEDPATTGIVHGDYRLDNCLVDEADQIRAVVDWEMSTLGDTRTDLALLLVYDELGQTAGGDVLSDVARAPGYPSREAQLARYAQTSGREPGDMAWHLALAYFKLAVILEGIHYRFLQGATVGDGFDQLGAGFDLIIGAGLDALNAKD